MPTFTYDCELVTASRTVDLPEGAEVVEYTDTDEGLRIWYRIPHQTDPPDECASDDDPP